MDLGWQLLSLRKEVANLVFYFDVPDGEATTNKGWDVVRQNVKECFGRAIESDCLARVIDPNRLTDRQSDALTLVSILHANAGMSRKEWGQDVPVAVRNLRQFCEQLETLERQASGVEAEPVSFQNLTHKDGTNRSDKSDTKTDNGKKYEINKRQPSAGTIAVGKMIRAAARSGDKLTKKQAIEDYLVDHSECSFTSIARELTDNPHLWKTKNGQKRTI